MKERLDILLVKRGLAPSREKAKAMIMEGNVFVENQREDKAGTSIPENAKIKIKGITDNCTGTLVKTFTISKAKQKITAKNVSVSLSKKSVNLKAKCSTGTLKYKSSNTGVAVVDSNGKLNLKKKGKTIITIKAKASRNYKVAKKKITVTVK